MAIKKWDVYHLFCHYTKPTPKYKYIVIVHVGKNEHIGFLINSQINSFILKNSSLLPCEAEIISSEHVFLTRDSFVDCRDAFKFQPSELNDFKGRLSSNAQQAVIKGVKDCKVLPRAIKKLILFS